MPQFEFRHGDPNPEIWGAMLFPDDPLKRESYIGGNRISYFSQYFEDREPAKLLDAAHQVDWKNRPGPDETQERMRNGLIAGELLKVIFAISASDPQKATWSKSASLLSRAFEISERKIWSAKERYMPSIHLWGAWCLRERRYYSDLSVGYRKSDDLGVFLVESMTLLQWAHRQVRPVPKSTPIISPSVDSWIVPSEWNPPVAKSGWPRDGRLQQAQLTPEWQARVGKRKPLQKKLQK